MTITGGRKVCVTQVDYESESNRFDVSLSQTLINVYTGKGRTQTSDILALVRVIHSDGHHKNLCNKEINTWA